MAGREIMWAPWNGQGLEHLRLAQGEAGVVADSVVIGARGDRTFRVRYVVACDTSWRVREVRLSSLDADDHQLHLRADGTGHWETAAGEPLHELDGCLDVDISTTPFTNTLPIRRLDLWPGQSRDLTVAYVAVPDFEIRPVPQRYTALERRADGALYTYEGLSTAFVADLPVDADGVVVDYPRLYRRVWTLATSLVAG